MRLEKIKPSELDTAVELANVAFPVEKSLLAYDFKQIMKSPDLYGHLYGAWITEAGRDLLIGIISYGRYYYGNWNGEGKISNLAVDPLQRRRGVATFMVDRAIADMKAEGVPCIGIDIAQNNPGAQAFWENYEFELYAKNYRVDNLTYNSYAMWFTEENNKGE